MRLPLSFALLAVLALPGCRVRALDRHPAYRPRSRDVTITTVPLLVKEMSRTLPFLVRDFAPGGVLADKEVYGFMPDHITAGEGDTLRLTFYNPEDDLHSFVLGGFAVGLAPQSVTHAVYVASRAGLFDFECSIPTHLPMMHGQLEVLPAAVMALMDGSAAGRR